MNAYDFDNTVFRGDSTARFYVFCLLRTPRMIRRVPRLLWEAAFLLKKDKQRFKQNMFAFLSDLDDPEKAVLAFWKKNRKRIKRFYEDGRRADDIILSASPEFLLRPILNELGVKKLIASPVDIRTGKYFGKNCHGAEKVRRLRAEYPDAVIENFYSDSHSDDPMAAAAKNAWFVNGETLSKWKNR